MKNFRKPYKNGDRFYNRMGEKHSGFFVKSIIMLFNSWWQGKRLGPSNGSLWVDISDPLSCSIDPVVTWVGHASFLIQIGGVNILTDPIFGGSSFLYPRFLEPGVTAEKMPNIDFVLISHNHRDHMDARSLMFLRKNRDTQFLVPKGDKTWFDRRNFVKVKDNNWWDRRSFRLKGDMSQEIHFTFLPAEHWSQRGLFDKNKSLWGSWMIEFGDNKIYFAGDTSYSSHFAEIKKEFDSINLALLPIGPCEPREWVKHTHINSAEAGQSFLDLQANHFVPMHWGTFPLGADIFDTPVALLQKWWSENSDKLKDKTLHIPKVGQRIMFDASGLCLKHKQK